jgi:hypothetical protein
VEMKRKKAKIIPLITNEEKEETETPYDLAA